MTPSAPTSNCCSMRSVFPMIMLLLAAWLACSPQAALAAAPQERRPNIVLIMTDDLGYEALSSHGSLDYGTPHLDRLAREGVRFDHCYSTPLCTPSRVQIMTGRYNFRNYRSFGYLDPQEVTFAHLLKSAGYATCIVGKWQLNGIYDKWPGHDDPTRPNQAGFDEYCLWQLTQDRREGERYADPLIERNGQVLGVQKGKYGPDLFCDYAIDFIDRHRDRPFFVYWPMVLPHSPFVPTPDSPEWADPSKRHKSDTRFFKDMVQYADKLIGRLVAHLDEAGLRENTLILFTSDNGTSRKITSRTVRGQVAGGKGRPTNAGTHVPLIASWPGVALQGHVSQDLVDFSDFLPTLAAAAGAELPASLVLDGRSFLPQIKGEAGKPREWIFCHYDPNWGGLSAHRTRFARTQRFKLYRDGRLIDIPMDVLEQEPLSPASEPQEAAAARRQLQAVLDAMPPWRPLKAPARQ